MQPSSALQCVHTPDTPLWCRHMEYDVQFQSTNWCFWPVVPPPYPAYSIYSTRHERRSQTQDLPTASHSSYHDKTAASVRTHCPCWSISRPLAGSTSSYQSSACGLATPAWSTKTNLASNDWARPPAAQSRPQLGVEACAGTFQVASTRGDSYVQSRTRHSMMMMMIPERRRDK